MLMIVFNANEAHFHRRVFASFWVFGTHKWLVKV